MIARWQTLLLKLEGTLARHVLARALCYALMAAAIYAVWLLTDGESVSFVYSEF